VPRAPVIGVMPLTNASGDAANDYLAVGIADSLVTRLASLPTVTVLSRSAVAEAYRQSPRIPVLAADLGAAYLVDGSVQQAGDVLQITLSLMRPDGSLAWADTVQGPFRDVFALQTRLASALTQALSVQATAAARVSLARQPTMNPQALAAYWRGRALLDRTDIAGNSSAALAAFDEAIRQDPRFAEAHAARGEALWARYRDARDPADARAAIDAGTAALRLDPNRAEVRFALAVTLEGTGQLDAAIEEAQRALALRPTYEDARLQLARVLAQQNRIDEAIAEYRRVIDLRPNNVLAHSRMGVSLFEARRYREAAEVFERITALQPDNAVAHQQVGTAYHALGDLDRALAAYERSLAIRPFAPALSNVGTIYYQRREYAKAVDAYQQAIAVRPNARETHRNLGDALARLGRAQEARRAYQRAVALAESDVKVNPSNARIVASLALYLQKAGRPADAERRLAEAIELAPRDFEVLRRAAQVHALAGRAERALDALEAAVGHGLPRQDVTADEDFQALRSTPRFQSLVKVP
jgi:tetratricopeptide (TPR) repeat protein